MSKQERDEILDRMRQALDAHRRLTDDRRRSEYMPEAAAASEPVSSDVAPA